MSYIEEIPLESTDTKRIVDLIDKINWITQTFDYENATEIDLAHLKNTYEYALRKITEWREETKQSHKISFMIEPYNNIIEFMNKYFSSEDRVKCSDVTKSIRKCCGMKKTKKDIQKELDDQDHYRMISLHNVSYIIRL